jgi:hypothetical protein
VKISKINRSGQRRRNEAGRERNVRRWHREEIQLRMLNIDSCSVAWLMFCLGVRQKAIIMKTHRSAFVAALVNNDTAGNARIVNDRIGRWSARFHFVSLSAD